MEIKIGEYDWLFQSAERNILRCTLNRDRREKQESLIVRSEVFEGMRELEENDDIKVEQNGEKIIFRLPNDRMLEIQEYELRPIDVIRYTTGSEAPCIEIVQTVDGQRTRIRNLRPFVDREAFAGFVGFRISKSAYIYGLGQDENGVYNKRGTKQYLYQHNMLTPMPFFVTNEGYGVFFDCASLMIFDDTGETTRLYLDTVNEIDFYLMTGTLDEIVSAIRYLTGPVVLLPKWAFGYIQSRERYKTQFEMLNTARRYREAGVPLDCVVQDWKTWPGDLWGQKTVDRERYPDLSEMNRQLHELNVHSMVSIWPNMARGGSDHLEFSEAGHLLGDDSTYDAFSAEARALYWRQANKELFSGGFDAWWCDSTEPFTAPDWCGEARLPEETRYDLVGGEHKKYLDPASANLYAFMHAKGIYENQRKERPNQRVMNLTRSGYPGIQQYGVALWAGDTSASWDVLKKDIVKGISLCMCGLPFWTIDIGGFFAGGTACWRRWRGEPNAEPVWFWNGAYDEGVKDPAYRELYTRWLQLGAFLPLFRSHGTDTPREIWNFGEPGEPFYDSIEKFIKLRYTLMPYLYSAAMRAALEHYTMMRSLLFDFSFDPKVALIDDAFMFGDSILVYPVTEPMYFDLNGSIERNRKKTCYLPKCAGWYSLWNDTYYEGGRTVTVDAGIDTMPVFVKAGSILPTQRQTVYAMETAEALELHIYRGADAECSYYSDDGLSYDYQQGKYEKIKFHWDDENRRLTIREENRFRDRPIQMIIRFNHTETKIHYDGGEKQINLD